jgi:hypothetical protein
MIVNLLMAGTAVAPRTAIVSGPVSRIGGFYHIGEKIFMSSRQPMTTGARVGDLPRE